MKIIRVNSESKTLAWDALIKCKIKGEPAIIDFGHGFMNTTDDIPDDYMDINIYDLYDILRDIAIKRKEGQLEELNCKKLIKK